MPKNTYTIAMIPAPEGGYTVTCLDIPGAVSQGETVEEARAMIAEAIQELTAYRRDKERKALATEPGVWEETLEVDA
jgi:predicted RNase H-like HicB family nuclease